MAFECALYSLLECTVSLTSNGSNSALYKSLFWIFSFLFGSLVLPPGSS